MGSSSQVYRIKCIFCGQVGALKLIESDSPWGPNWERWSLLSGFTGGTAAIDRGFLGIPEALSQIRPQCEGCGTVDSAIFLDKANFFDRAS